MTKDYTLKDKVAVVTGANGGLGIDICSQLASLGARVVMAYNKNTQNIEAFLDRVEDKSQIIMMPLDVSDIRAVQVFESELVLKIEQHWQETGIDILVNNAGIGRHSVVGEVVPDDFNLLVDIHFKGAFFLAQELLPRMRDGGRIINVSSGLTRFSMPGYAVYAAVKGAMEVVSRYMAKELGNRNITVNSVAPGAIDNEFNAAAFSHMPELKETIAGQTALGRVGQSEDIGKVIAMLCSDAGQWITGQRIEASGGMFL